jgi:hypothetical protein
VAANFLPGEHCRWDQLGKQCWNHMTGTCPGTHSHAVNTTAVAPPAPAAAAAAVTTPTRSQESAEASAQVAIAIQANMCATGRSQEEISAAMARSSSSHARPSA